MIKNVDLKDAKAITSIYNHYIKNTTITFEEIEIDVEEMSKRIERITKDFFWIVYKENNKVVGYAYVSSFKGRSAYKNSVESSIYVDPSFHRKGIGLKLYKKIIELCSQKKFHTILGVVTYPNEKSAILHQKLGFEKVAHYKEVGFKFNEWIDTEAWQLLL